MSDLGNEQVYPHELTEQRGLTKRELFAAMAMQAYLSSSRSKASRAEEFAAVAVLLADVIRLAGPKSMGAE